MFNQSKERFFPVILLFFRQKRDQDWRIERLYVKFRNQVAEKFASFQKTRLCHIHARENAGRIRAKSVSKIKNEMLPNA